jgi:TonB-dependent starch-binding outer membrane protein SusC
VVPRMCYFWFALLAAAGVAPAGAQQRPITGRVTSAPSGEPVARASVAVAGTAITAVTSEQGEFSLAAPSSDVTLVVRRIGFKRREVAVPASQNRVEVTLEPDVFNLEAVVVTGIATGVERRNLGNAVATVGASDLGYVPTPSIEQQLQGKVAGADIQENSGAPGGGLQVRLRGVTSINATAEPLYVVDGVIVSDVAIPSNQNAVTAASGGSNPSLNQDAQVNRIADLNPNDIESMEILRGASASAIYGQKASNGVVVIKTKRGQSGAPQFTVTQKFGTFELSHEMGSRIFADSLSAVGAFGASAAKYFRADTTNPYFGRPGYTPGHAFDLEDELAGRRSLSYESAVSLSGGTDNTQYFASATSKKDGGIIDNTGFQRQAVRLNLDQKLGSRVRASLNTSYTRTLAQRGLTNNDNTGTSFYVVLSATPSFIDLGKQPGDTFARNPFVPSNPVQTAALMTNDENVWRFIGASTLQWDAVQTSKHYLRFIATGGADLFSQQNSLFFPPELQFEPNDGEPGTSLLSNSDNLNLNLNTSAVHTYTPSGNAFSATTSVGLQYARRRLDISRITSRNLTAGQQNVDAGTDITIGETRSLIKDLGLFAQEEFLADDQHLLLTAGIRADQSSLNADASKLYYFPKASASYRFVRPLGFVDEFKLRGAFGESGNEPTYGQKFTSLRITGKVGGIPGTVGGDTTGAKDLHPERERELEAGFDATLWNSHANLEFTAYQKNVSDLLLPRQLAPSNGINFEIFNGGKLRTRGIELSLETIPLQRSDLKWLFRTTFAMNRSVITELPIPSFSAGGFGASIGEFRVEQGASATQIVGNDTLTTADIASGRYPGDTVGQIVVRKVADANPDFRMSFTNDLTYRRLSLHFLLDWQKGSAILNLTKLLYDFGQVTSDYGDPLATPVIIPKAGGGADTLRTVGQKRLAGFSKVTSNYIESATFLKLREVTLTYDLPTSLIHSVWQGARYAHISVSGRNLFTSTPYTGLDPEVSNFGNQPIARNIDVTPFPPSRSFWFAIDVGF